MSEKPQILLVNEFHPETIEKLDSLYRTYHLWKLDREQKLELITSLKGSCRAAASASWNCDELAYTLDSLELISCFGVGVDGIDFEITNARGISVSNTPGVLDDAVADVAMALILSTLRNTVAADKYVRDGAWHSGPFKLGHSLANKTLGVIGLGRIGQAIVERALPFKMNIAYHNRSPKDLPHTYYSSINELAQKSDILLCMLPGGAATRAVIDADVFRHLGPSGIFVNVGRGTSVDEDALIAALETGQIAGAGLDVYAKEPHVPSKLLTMEQVVLFPHIGSATVETRRDMGDLVIRNLQAFFDNKPLCTPIDQA